MLLNSQNGLIKNSKKLRRKIGEKLTTSSDLSKGVLVLVRVMGRQEIICQKNYQLNVLFTLILFAI